ncbi:MAG: hypothetical protein RLZZ324_1313 [Candidatus Parcubacteria bacterium]
MTKQFRDDRLGVAFDYHGGQNGFVLLTLPATPEENMSVGRAAVYQKSTYEASQRGNWAEGPESITMTVFPAPDVKDAMTWIEAHPGETSFGMSYGPSSSNPPADIAIGGVPALQWDVDGLYSETYRLALVNGRAYLFTGPQGGNDKDPLVMEYAALLNSISFFPTGLLAADSAAPAAPVCPDSVGSTVNASINEDIPSPRCVKVAPGQSLQITNATQKSIDVWLGPDKGAPVSSKLRLKPGETGALQTLPGDVLDYGVHHLQTSAFAGPAIWMVPTGAKTEQPMP